MARPSAISGEVRAARWVVKSHTCTYTYTSTARSLLMISFIYPWRKIQSVAVREACDENGATVRRLDEGHRKWF